MWLSCRNGFVIAPMRITCFITERCFVMYHLMGWFRTWQVAGKLFGQAKILTSPHNAKCLHGIGVSKSRGSNWAYSMQRVQWCETKYIKVAMLVIILTLTIMTITSQSVRRICYCSSSFLSLYAKMQLCAYVGLTNIHDCIVLKS